MQISGVNLALTWSHRLWLFRVLLCGSLCYKLSPFQALGKVTLSPCCQAWVFIYSSCGKWVFPPLLCSFPPTATFTNFPAPDYRVVLLLLPAAMFVYSSRGKWVFPPFLWSFSPSATLTCFPTPGCWTCVPLPPEPFLPTRLVYLQSREGFPSPNLQRSVSLFFSPGGGQSVQGAMLLWPKLVCGGTVVPWSSPGPCLTKPYGRWPLAVLGALLVSPFKVRWRFSAQAGDVEGSKLCLFSVIMPAKCVSGISPRFHYRRLTFCFLPLATILEFLWAHLLMTYPLHCLYCFMFHHPFPLFYFLVLLNFCWTNMNFYSFYLDDKLVAI
jgi:hypothetical protein